MDEARAAMHRSLELDPLLLITNVNLGRIDYYLKNYDQAIKQYEKALELDQHFTRTHFRLGLAYMQKGDFQNARLEYKQVTKLAGDTPQVDSYLAYLLAVSGKRTEALKELENLQERGKREYVSPYNIALIYVGLGEKDKAFEWLEKAYLDHSTEMIYFKVDPLLEPLHSDSRYQNILQRMKLAN
jgi:Flp pilus assembly protein TadD